jgi:hypothetical protein
MPRVFVYFDKPRTTLRYFLAQSDGGPLRWSLTRDDLLTFSAESDAETIIKTLHPSYHEIAKIGRTSAGAV